MKLSTLAVRMVSQRRRLMLRAAIPLGLAAFVSVLVMAFLGEISQTVGELERTQLRGELRRETILPPESEALVSAGLLRSPVPDNVLVSSAIVMPAVLDAGTESMIATVWFTDVARETVFRSLTPADPTGPHEPPQPDRLGNLPLLSLPDTDPATGNTTSREPEIVGIRIPGFGAISVDRYSTVRLAELHPIILLPRELVPELLSARNEGQQSASDSELLAKEVIRVRGVTPMEPALQSMVAEKLGLVPSGWKEAGAERMRDLWLLGVSVAAILVLAGGIAAAPSAAIVVQRHAAEFRLLMDSGYSSRFIKRLVVTMCAISGAFSGAAGSLMAAVALTIGNLRGGFQSSFLPLYWQTANPAVGSLAPAAPIVPMALAIAVTTAVASLSALPAARVAATIGPHGTVWR